MNAITGMALLVTLGAAACAPDDGADTDGIPTDTMPVTQQPTSPTTLDDAQIIHIVSTANTADSAGGVLAQERGTNAAVKAFAQRMVQDHGGANQQLRQLTQSANIAPTDNEHSRQLQTEHQQATQMLQGQSGAAFDRAYIEHEVEMHREVLRTLDERILPNVQNTELRQQLQTIRTAVQSHLQQAEQIQGQLGQTGQDTAAQ